MWIINTSIRKNLTQKLQWFIKNNKFINIQKAMTSSNNDLRENQIPQVVEPSLYRIQAIKYRVSQRVPERMAGSFHFPWGRCTGGRHPRPPALALKTLIEGGVIPPWHLGSQNLNRNTNLNILFCHNSQSEKLANLIDSINKSRCFYHKKNKVYILHWCVHFKLVK